MCFPIPGASPVTRPAHPPSLPATPCPTWPHPAEGSDYEMSEEELLGAEAEEDEDEENECDRCKTRQSEAWCTHPATGE